MSANSYKSCVVHLCKSTTIATPKKLFIHVPMNKAMRDEWLKLAGRQPTDLSPRRPIYFCEDHFDLPHDMENYMRYHVMGSLKKVRLIPGCLPSKLAAKPVTPDVDAQHSETLMNTDTIPMETQSAEPDNPFSMFEVSQVCATCTKHLIEDRSYSLNTLVDPPANVNLFHVLESLFQFKCEENGPSNMCTECYSLTLLVYEFHQQCKNSVMLFKKHIECQQQFATPKDIDLVTCDIDATPTIKVEAPDERLVEPEKIWIYDNTLIPDHQIKQEVESVDNEILCCNSDRLNTQSIPPANEFSPRCSLAPEEVWISDNALVKVEDEDKDENNIEVSPNHSKAEQNAEKLNIRNKSKPNQNDLYECTLCEAVYDKYTSLLFHINIHNRRFVCSYCDKAFGSKYALQQHEKGQHNSGKRPYECNECGRGFNLKCNLDEHKKNIHATKRPFVCEICQKTFGTIGVLRRHVQIHTDIKPYACTECNMRFIFAYDLKRHLRRIHKIEEIPIQETSS